MAKIVHQDDSTYIPPAKYGLIHEAALKACDALDGIADGVIEDPRRCRFDPGTLQCADGDGAPVSRRRKWKPRGGSMRRARTLPAERNSIPASPPGSEPGWATYGGARPFGIGSDYARFVLFHDPGWDYRSLDAPAAAAEAARVDQGITNAPDPDQRTFFAHGGKLIQYHGWSDPQISAHA